jgi:C1A family cysteine protease
MHQVRDSGCEGSCVGFAVAAALEDQIRKARTRGVTISPRYIYYYAREQGGFPTDCDTGAHLKDAIDFLLHRGAVAERVWPYKAGEFAAKPPPVAERALHYRISRAQRIHDVEELKAALERAWSVVGGLSLFPSAYSERVSRTGRIPLPGLDEPVRSAAAVCFVGFDDTKGLLKFRTPWGRGWGDHGYGYVSYGYARRFLSDAWAITM